MIKVGDRVKFLNDVGGGVVTGFVNKNVVNVENEDGFEVPYPVSKLINVDAPELSRDYKTAEKEPVVEEKEVAKPESPAGKIIKGKNSPDFYFCLVPTDSGNPLAGEIELYLVNDSNFTLLFQYSHFQESKYASVKHGEIQPNSRIRLESLVQSELSDLPEFCFQLLLFSEEQNEWYKPVQKKFRINPVKFYKESSFQSNLFFERNAMVLQISENLLNVELDKLTQEDFQKVVENKDPKPVAEQPVKKKVAEVVEVDLHIHALIDNSAGLSNKEILDIQLEKVESEMRSAIANGIKRIVFIHGVGQGVLKQEVAKLLRHKFPKYYHQDASFQEYGYGATMVILRRK